MKSMMGFGFFLLFLAGIALVMLQGKQVAQQKMGGGAEMTGVNWRPTVIGAESMPEDSGMFVQFEVDGSIKGHGGCNGFFGSLEQSDSGVAVGPLGSTRMACADEIMNRESVFMEALQQGRAFEMGTNRLQVLDENGRLLVELIRG